MNATERKAAQQELQDAVGLATRDITDRLNNALTTELYPDGLPQSLRRVLSTAQIAAQEYGPAVEPPSEA